MARPVEKKKGEGRRPRSTRVPPPIDRNAFPNAFESGRWLEFPVAWPRSLIADATLKGSSSFSNPTPGHRAALAAPNWPVDWPELLMANAAPLWQHWPFTGGVGSTVR